MTGRRGILRRLAAPILLFAAGVGVGYYVRDRNVHQEVGRAVREARAEMERMGDEALERARRAAGNVAAGAAAAAESTRAGVRDLVNPPER